MKGLTMEMIGFNKNLTAKGSTKVRGGTGSTPNGSAGPQTPGQTAQMGRSSANHARGGSTKQLPNGKSTPAPAA